MQLWMNTKSITTNNILVFANFYHVILTTYQQIHYFFLKICLLLEKVFYFWLINNFKNLYTMEEQVQNPKPLKGFSIAGIIIGSIALLLSLFSFAGAMFSWAAASAIWPGIIALILGILGLIFASRAKAKKGLAVAVIVISIIAVGLGYYGVSKSMSAFEEAAGDLDQWAEEMNNALDELENVE